MGGGGGGGLGVRLDLGMGAGLALGGRRRSSSAPCSRSRWRRSLRGWRKGKGSARGSSAVPSLGCSVHISVPPQTHGPAGGEKPQRKCREREQKRDGESVRVGEREREKYYIMRV